MKIPRMPNRPPPRVTAARRPEAGQTYSSTYHTGENHVSLDLLQNDDENQEEQHLQRTNGQNHDSADKSANKGAHQRNQSGNADQNTDRQRIGESKDLHADETERTKDQCFDTLAGKVVRKGAV